MQIIIYLINIKNLNFDKSIHDFIFKYKMSVYVFRKVYLLFKHSVNRKAHFKFYILL